MITETEAVAIAAAFVKASRGRELPLCGARYQDDPTAHARRLGIAFNANDELCRPCWAVAFQTILDDGNLMDGATIVDVDAETGQARYFDDAWGGHGQRADA
jgi:hypothetical protein